ncbi:MAG: hypothetical protein K2Q14_06605, partial [Gammaproteobacteria bacterium]|nr:hypothetical protein [Gammaproteobacteria bacterium]
MQSENSISENIIFLPTKTRLQLLEELHQRTLIQFGRYHNHNPNFLSDPEAIKKWEEARERYLPAQAFSSGAMEHF